MQEYLWMAGSIFKIAIFITVIVICCVRMKKDNHFASPYVIFFVLSVSCLLAEEAYFLFHLVLRESERMPFFSAEDIGAYGGLMLFTASLRTCLKCDNKYSVRHIVFAGGFAVVNAGMYVYFGTEILSAAIYAATMGYFLVNILQCFDNMKVLNFKKFVVLRVGGALLCALLILEMFIDEDWGKLWVGMEAFLWFAAMAYVIVRTVNELRSKRPTAVALSYALWLLCLFTMYMSYNPWYTIADTMSAVSTIPIYMALAREAVKS